KPPQLLMTGLKTRPSSSNGPTAQATTSNGPAAAAASSASSSSPAPASSPAIIIGLEPYGYHSHQGQHGGHAGARAFSSAAAAAASSSSAVRKAAADAAAVSSNPIYFRLAKLSR